VNKTRTTPLEESSVERAAERATDETIAEAWRRASEQADQPRYTAIEREPGHVRIVPRALRAVKKGAV